MEQQTSIKRKHGGVCVMADMRLKLSTQDKRENDFVKIYKHIPDQFTGRLIVDFNRGGITSCEKIEKLKI